MEPVPGALKGWGLWFNSELKPPEEWADNAKIASIDGKMDSNANTIFPYQSLVLRMSEECSASKWGFLNQVNASFKPWKQGNGIGGSKEFLPQLPFPGGSWWEEWGKVGLIKHKFVTVNIGAASKTEADIIGNPASCPTFHPISYTK